MRLTLKHVKCRGFVGVPKYSRDLKALMSYCKMYCQRNSLSAGEELPSGWYR